MKVHTQWIRFAMLFTHLAIGFLVDFFAVLGVTIHDGCEWIFQ
ncbi:hypothetical protein [Kaarinaea lacus]